MNSDLICPFLSRPVAVPAYNGHGDWKVEQLFEVACLKERCAAWKPGTQKTYRPGDVEITESRCRLIP